jgi:hypothetical protein
LAIQGFVRTFLAENFDEVIEPGLLLKEVQACDTRNRLTNLGVNASATAIASYAYTLDAVGHRLSISEQSECMVNYGYDNLYRLAGETIAGDPNGVNGAVNYIYDAVDEVPRGGLSTFHSPLAALRGSC